MKASTNLQIKEITHHPTSKAVVLIFTDKPSKYYHPYFVDDKTETRRSFRLHSASVLMISGLGARIMIFEKSLEPNSSKDNICDFGQVCYQNLHPPYSAIEGLVIRIFKRTHNEPHFLAFTSCVIPSFWVRGGHNYQLLTNNPGKMMECYFHD